MAKTKKIIFRVNEDLYEFITKFAHDKGMTISDLSRNILSYWFMSFYTGDLKLNYDSLKEKFLCIMNKIDENNNKK
jgi:hypothetical protein